MRLEGRVAFVTGSSRGIGEAIARRLAADGAKVILHASKERSRVDALAREIEEAGRTAGVVIGDLTEGDKAADLVDEAFAIHGALDILVCNAGGGVVSTAVETDHATMDRIMALNLRAPMIQTMRFLKLTASSHGRVIFISSATATNPAPGSPFYSAAKAGGEAFMRSVAQEAGDRGITLNSVAPGATATEAVRGQPWTGKVASWTALGRIGEPADIADIVAFVASDEARWLTGACLPANGGQITSAMNILVREI